MTPQEWARKAQQLWDDDVLQKAFTDTEDDITKNWKDAATSEERERLFYELEGLRHLKQRFQIYFTNGKKAERKING